jgi:hypothetical protein
MVHNEFEYDFDNDDDADTFEDPAWCHLNPIYTILIKLIHSPNFQKELASLFIDMSFTSKLIDMIDSPNFRERNMAKYLLFCIFEKLVKLIATEQNLIEVKSRRLTIIFNYIFNSTSYFRNKI